MMSGAGTISPTWAAGKGNGGNVTVNVNSPIYTTGAGAYGVIAESAGGGGGGVGKLQSLQLMKVEAAPTIYHQPGDGDRNYHQMPAALAPHCPRPPRS